MFYQYFTLYNLALFCNLANVITIHSTLKSCCIMLQQHLSQQYYVRFLGGVKYQPVAEISKRSLRNNFDGCLENEDGREKEVAYFQCIM